MSQLKPQDLRIDNLIEFDGKIFKVKAIEQYIVTADQGKGNVDFTYNEINPVPITEEWILKAGFLPATAHDYFYKNIFLINFGNAYYRAFLEGKTKIDIELTTINQLQNLIHSMTGEELEINLK